MNSKKIIYITLTIFLFFIFYISFTNISFAAYPKLVNKLGNAFEKIETYIITISTPAAAVSIGTGFLMQKFSFGDEERIRTGKKLIRISVISYVFILLLDLVIAAIENLIS